jgi:hypothetical protein
LCRRWCVYRFLCLNSKRGFAGLRGCLPPIVTCARWLSYPQLGW